MNILKKILSIVILGLAMLCLVSCSANRTDTTPEQALENGMAALKAMEDNEEVEKWFETNPYMTEANRFSGDDDEAWVQAQAMSADLSYTVHNMDEPADGQSAVLSCTVTNKKIPLILGDFMNQVIANSMVSKDSGEHRDMGEYLCQLLDNITETVDIDVDIQMFRNEETGEWVIAVDDALINALTGGMVETMGSISDAASDLGDVNTALN